MQRIDLAIFSLLVLGLTSCATTGTHQFASPATNWQSKAGQLAYAGPKMKLIGEVLVRYSAAGDFELTFTKGPGVKLLVVRQDAQFASAEGPLAHGRWSGPTVSGPARLRGWFGLRAKIISGGKSIRASSGGESFNLQF